MTDLRERFASGETRALAQVITQVENRRSGSFDLLRTLFPRSGNAKVVGITGSPGSGKSTIVDGLGASYRREGSRLGILAIDPSSPFTRGALLGDRIRMHSVEADSGVYIRSMATRGHLGGLAAATADVITVLDAAGRDPVIVETVGVGQDEVDIVKVADVSVVVLVPETGDDVQALKAGIMEIGDIFVINKCDLDGVDQTQRSLEAALDLAPRSEWRPPIVRMVARRDEGTDELKRQIETFYDHSRRLPETSQRKRDAMREQLIGLLEERLVQGALQAAFAPEELDHALDAMVRRETDPYTLVDRILAETRFGRTG